MPRQLHVEVIPMSDLPSTEPDHFDGTAPRVVLVVDDEKVIADTLSIILRNHGFSVLTAYGAAAALEIASLAPPELLLSDVVMGEDMDGTQLATRIVKDFPDCKVVLFSGHGSVTDLLQRVRQSGQRFTVLTKPLHPAELVTHVQQALNA